MKRFQDLEQFDASDIEAAIARDRPGELQFVPLIVALASPDPAAAQSVCIRLCCHSSNRVRAHAVISFGHLARRFRVLDEKSVKPLIERALNDTDDYVRVHAKSAADEIHQFLHWEITGHVYG